MNVPSLALKLFYSQAIGCRRISALTAYLFSELGTGSIQSTLPFSNSLRLDLVFNLVFERRWGHCTTMKARLGFKVMPIQSREKNEASLAARYGLVEGLEKRTFAVACSPESYCEFGLQESLSSIS